MTVDGQSSLLSPGENQQLWQAIQASHRKNQVLAIAVVKLYLSNQGAWKEKVTGAACLTKDYGRKSYFIQIFDMEYCQQVWEQELYLELQYRAPLSYFHTFEAEHTVAGLSFADEGEGRLFQGVVQGKVSARRERSEMGRAPGPAGAGSPMAPHKVVELGRLPARKEGDRRGKKTKKGEKGRKISKLDITGPTNFVHVTGVKPDGGGTMKMVDNSHLVDPVLKKLFSSAGLNPASLGVEAIEQAKEFAKKENLYEHYEKQKEQKERRRTMNQRSVRPPPPPQAPGGRPRPPGPPPSVPHRTPPSQRSPRPPCPRPPPARPGPLPGGRGGGGGPPPSGGGPPPPPPPPPPGPGPPPPPGPAAKPGPPSVPKSSGMSMAEQLANHGGLSKAPPPEKPAASAGGRDNFLNQIAQGVPGGLKKVDPNRVRESPVSAKSGEGGLTGLLTAALDDIRTAMEDSSDEDNSGSDSDEWDD